MLKNYFIVALRSFLRNKIFSAIHVLGLSVGISASLIIFLIVQYELSFDTFEADADRIYRVVMNFNFNGTEGHSSAVPAPLANAVQNEVSGIEETVPVMQFQGDATVNVTVSRPASDKPILFKHQPSIVFTTNGYFRMLSFQWLIGSPERALTDPFMAVLTESRARLYFPGMPLTDIPGQQIVYDNNLKTTVAGIVKDLEEPTDFTSLEFISYSTIDKTILHDNFMMDVWDDWMAYSKLYVKLRASNDKTGVETQMARLLKKYHKNANKDAGRTMAFGLQPLGDIHFDTNYAGFGQRTAHKGTLYGLLAIAAFLLILGCINFTNLATAQASKRAREIGIRKTVGSSRKQLVLQFLSETLCVTAAATILSVSITPFLLAMFADFIPQGLSFELWNKPFVLVFLTLITFLVSILSGSYPALILSGFRPSLVLRNQAFASAPTRSAGIRKILTVSQFVIAQFFVIAALMVSKQIHFALNQDLGFAKEAILSFPMPRDTAASHHELIRDRIEAMPEVQMVSLGFLPPATDGAAFANITYNQNGQEIKENVQIRLGDSHFIDLYKIRLVAGRNVQDGEHVNEVLINEQYAKVLGFRTPEDALQKELTMSNGTNAPIVGVMHDFHEGSFHGHIGSMVFQSRTNSNFVHIALLPQDEKGTRWQNAISKIEKIYAGVYPNEDFNYTFFDDAIARFYTREQNISRLLRWATGLSILISCLGLLGLVIYTSETRTKEIGIRKILGASVANIVSILSLEFVRLVVIAFAISAPLAWWSIHQWLQGFAYRTSMSWWVFAASGLFLLLAAVLTLSAQTIKTATANPVKSLRTE